VDVQKVGPNMSRLNYQTCVHTTLIIWDTWLLCMIGVCV